MSNPFDSEHRPKPLTVSQLNRKARTLLEGHFDFVWVEGEISNFAAPSSGHWYFTLKDNGAQVRCAMFRNRNQRVRFTPSNGDLIRLRCRVSLYEGRGEFQIIAEYMEPMGAGALQAAFEQLKTRLLAEGLFNPDKKQPLPETISHIGVITSPTGAAIHDILTVLKRRCPAINVSILPVPVQGDGAAAKIVGAIATANRWHIDKKIHFDALIVGRGGGSLEDLWAFNEEIVARAIAASQLPIVSAVGHEVDFSIADMTADVRAPTPSAAAELLSPDQQAQLMQLQRLEADLARMIQRKLSDAQTQVAQLAKRLKHPTAQLREQSQRLDELEQRLIAAQNNSLARKRSEIALANSRLAAKSPLPRIQQAQRDVSKMHQRLETGMHSALHTAGGELAHLAQMLDSLSPLSTLQRGYSIVTDSAGAVVTDAAQVQPGDPVKARLSNGELDLVVTGAG